MRNKVRIFALGKKAFIALKNLDSTYLEFISEVVIGVDKNIREDFSKQITQFCSHHQVNNHIRGKHEPTGPESHLIAIGWRWMIIKEPDQQLLVFHDSLLPRYRGFNPLVSALINGDSEIGVTCLKGAKEFDKGNIISQYRKRIEYPIKIETAIDIVSEGYAQLLNELIVRIALEKTIEGEEQDESLATYSVWRDAEDYYINWQWPAQQIKRLIDAVGYPYLGARCYMDGQEVVIHEAEVAPSVEIENEGIGKVLFKDGMLPIVICGKGLLKIKQISLLDGGKVSFPSKFRYRFK